ncbi:hypothetical protein L596_021042 [Steinernema carpocapsae]|uniref:Uncharacterized protein n=1 Tax=Steinernema carpocapsae TaxID=34508 RepID=A0A4U5MVB3_STECR|nr:hypothetical protein L596_021042 [Steinernema carpocapsae]
MRLPSPRYAKIKRLSRVRRFDIDLRPVDVPERHVRETRQGKPTGTVVHRRKLQNKLSWRKRSLRNHALH